jgi:hypothetical protein
MDFVVAFMGGILMREISTRPQDSIVVILGENSSNCIARRVCLNYTFPIRMEMAKYL